MLFWKRLFTWRKPVPPAPPRIGRVVMHPIRCVGCGKALEHGDLIVTVEGRLSTGERFPYTGHAPCMVVVRKPDGSLDGVPHKHSVEIAEADWARWKEAESRGETPIGDLRIISFNEHGLARVIE